jgi:small subunit ribosomal protein S7
MAQKKLNVEDQVEIFTKVVDNIRPTVEVRSKRVGGANYQVPREVRRNRQQSLAIRWLVDNSRKKKGKPMAHRLAEEFVDAYNGTGASVSQKETVHKMAEANKAYSHFAR